MSESNHTTFELKGNYVVLLILALTAVVGSLFIYLGPRATAKTPGIVHVGLRYMNEQTIEFLKYGKKGPPAKIEFIDQNGDSIYTFSELRLGRNLVPLEDLPTGPYTIRVSSEDFKSAEISVIIEGRMLNPAPDIAFTPGTYADYNMIGVRLWPLALDN